MTREERHIAVLNRLLENMDVYDSVQPTEERKKAIKAAIQALSQEPTKTQMIDKSNFDIEQYKMDLDTAYECGKAEARQTGKWIDYSDEGYVECPFCEHATTCEDNIDELHYCFYCGARMVEPQESEVRNE